MFDTVAQREIGPYVVHELIGWSDMSRVYRATDTSRAEAEVAIKVLNDSSSSEAGNEQRFMREIEIADMLSHPHILAVLGFGREQGVLFMVMPLVKGGTLADVLRLRSPLSPRQTLIIAEQIGAALDYIHSFQLVHRDIKPANILLWDENNYMLADFGLVMRADVLAEMPSHTVMGTPMHMSPEQEGGYRLDHRSDLYALGIVLFECLTGCPPYSPRPFVDTRGNYVAAPPISPHQINNHVPTCLEAPLLRGVEKDRALRFQSGREMADALGAAIDELEYEEADHLLILEGDIEGAEYLTQRAAIRMAVPVMAGTEEIAARFS